MNERGWVPSGSEGSSEVAGVGVEVIRMVTDLAPSSDKGVRYGVFGRCGLTAMIVEVLLGQRCRNDCGQYGHRHLY